LATFFPSFISVAYLVNFKYSNRSCRWHLLEALLSVAAAALIAVTVHLGPCYNNAQFWRFLWAKIS
jgi:uncharacterized membrane protein